MIDEDELEKLWREEEEEERRLREEAKLQREKEEAEKLQREREEEEERRSEFDWRWRQLKSCFTFIVLVWAVSGVGLIWANDVVRFFSFHGGIYFTLLALLYGGLFGFAMRLVNSFLARRVLPLVGRYIPALEPKQSWKDPNLNLGAVGWVVWIVFAILTFKMAALVVADMAAEEIRIMGG